MEADHDQVEDLLNQALAFAPEQRAAFLAGACGSHNALREKLETLLKAHSEADGFLPEAPTGLTASIPEGPGTQIDKYKLLERLGEGGFGVVYMAEQREPVKRRVALKIIKIGMDTREVVARFEAERQTLALLDHPNIAKILDAGVTGEGALQKPEIQPGRPYFVMELVRGFKITDYCDEKRLSTRERLDLFIKVCQAVQHAHQKGIIHRDLKPSNILVTVNDGVAVPKIIDFGIAKATQAELTGKTLFTRFHQFLGTPAYMSPEQAEMTSLDIDTRSDIYSLGVLLYELLTGQTPFDAEELLKAGLDEMRRVIREKEPERPSTRMIRERGLTKSAIRNPQSEIDKDLDWIAMKCLEKDRARRYETANGLASDIQRHLSNEPVIARPPTVTYRLQKLVRRNKLAFAAAGIVMTALVVGLGAALWQSIEKTRAYNRAVAAETAAKTAAAKSQQVAQFLQDMLKGVGPSKAVGRDTTMLKEILDKTAKRVSKQLTNQPQVEYEIRAILANVYDELGLYEEAERMARENLTLARSHAPKIAIVAEALEKLGNAQRQLGNYDEAEKFLREAVAMQRRFSGNENIKTALAVNNLAVLHFDRGKYAEAADLHRQVLALLRKLLGNEHERVALALNNLAADLENQNNLQEAETFHRQALAIQRKLLGNEHPEVALSLNNLAHLLSESGKDDEAATLYQEALAMSRKLLGNEHPDIARGLDALGGIAYRKGHLAEAEALSREALAMYQKLLGNEHRRTVNCMGNIGIVLFEQDKLDEAETMLGQALAMQRKLFGNEHPHLGTTLDSLARVLDRKNRLDEAESLNREALALRSKLLGNEHPEVAQSVIDLALVLQREGKFGDVETLYRDQLPGIRVGLPDHPQLANALAAFTSTLLSEGKFAEAEPVVRECLSVREKKLPDHWRTFSAKSMLGSSLLRQKKYNEAEPFLLSGYEGLNQREAKVPAGGKSTVTRLIKEGIQNLAQLYDATGRSDQAAEWKKKLEEFDKAHTDKQPIAPVQGD